jgi:anti-sigma regulatory factor (Ser/Thr protein kinase)
MKRTRSFKHTVDSVTAARRFVQEVLQDAPPSLREEVTLMVSELASNCIRHTDSDFDLTISQIGDEIRVEATDCGGGVPTMRTPAPTDPSGRGLQIIDMFSTTWGHETRPGKGKTVWFSVMLEAATAA